MESNDPIKLRDKTKKELKKYRDPFAKEWTEYDDAYYGKQHKTGDAVKRVKNHIFKIVEGEVPILTDSMAGTEVISDIEDRQDDAEELSDAITHVYETQSLPLILPTLVRSSLISAPGYLHPYFDPDADNGQGQIRYRKLPWKCVFLDGNSQLVEDSEKAHFEIPMRRDEIARRFPDKKEEILQKKSDKWESGEFDDGFENKDVSTVEGMRGKPAMHKADDILMYCETWTKSYDLEDIPQEETLAQLEEERAQLLNGEAPDIGKWESHDTHQQDHLNTRAELLASLSLPGDVSFDELSEYIDRLVEANPKAGDQFKAVLLAVKIIDNHIEEHEELKKQNPSGQKPKYADSWRVIKSVSDVVLYDGPNPEMDQTGLGRGFGIPLVPFYAYKDDTIYGFGEVKNILNAQRSLNWVDQCEFDNLKLVSNSGWVTDDPKLKDKLTNKPGIEVIKQKGTSVERLPSGMVSPQLANRRTEDSMFMEDAAGVNEATQGKMPSSSASGVTIQKLQNQAIGRIRLKDRYLQHYSMKRLAKITACLILNNWSTEKRIRIRKGTERTEFVFDPIKFSDLGFSIEITTGSMVGYDKEALNAYYQQLLDKGHITYREFLQVVDIPKKETLIKALDEREDIQGNIEALQLENLKLKAIAAPEMLSPEEAAQYEQIIKEEQYQQLLNTGAVGQPVQQGIDNGI